MYGENKQHDKEQVVYRFDEKTNTHVQQVDNVQQWKTPETQMNTKRDIRWECYHWKSNDGQYVEADVECYNVVIHSILIKSTFTLLSLLETWCIMDDSEIFVAGIGMEGVWEMLNLEEDEEWHYDGVTTLRKLKDFVRKKL